MTIQRLRMIIGFIIFAFLIPSFAFAKEVKEAPIKLSLVNVSKKGGNKGYKTLLSRLKNNPNIDLKSQRSVIKVAKKLGIKREQLRSGKWRKRNSKKIKKLLVKANLESLMLLDIYSRGKKAQLVTMGPDGKQVASVRKKIRRSRITRGKAKEMLLASFKPLAKSVRAARGDDEQEEADDVESDDEETDLVADTETGEDEESEDANEDLIASVTTKPKSDFPELEPKFKVNLGMIVGKREITLNSTTGKEFVLKHENPYLGLGGQVDGVLMNFGTMGLGMSVFGGYAPFTTIFENKQEFASRFAQFGGDLRFLVGLSKMLTLNIIAGAETTSITIDDNPFYTGTRYISARLGGGVSYSLGQVRVEANFVILPIFNTNTADGAYGETSGMGIGFAPNIMAQFDITDMIFAGLRYDFRLLPATYTKAPVLTDHADMESSDLLHSGFLSIGYNL